MIIEDLTISEKPYTMFNEPFTIFGRDQHGQCYLFHWMDSHHRDGQMFDEYTMHKIDVSDIESIITNPLIRLFSLPYSLVEMNRKSKVWTIKQRDYKMNYFKMPDKDFTLSGIWKFDLKELQNFLG